MMCSNVYALQSLGVRFAKTPYFVTIILARMAELVKRLITVLNAIALKDLREKLAKTKISANPIFAPIMPLASRH